jgi:type VI secretion system protein ImpM
MQQQLASPVGFYGKLPCKGDFLQRRVSQDFVDGWDRWLQECMHASRQQLGDGWLQAYLNGPVWRFALAEGVCGGGAYAGVIVPSVDRVGRYFPLAVLTQLSTDECLLEVACGGSAWFDAAEALAVEALQATDLDLENFDDRVAELTGQLERSSAAEAAYLVSLMHQGDFARAPGQWQVPLVEGRSLQNAVNAFASRELQRVLRPLALWWSDGSEAVAPGWLCTRGLPDPSSFAALLAGNWRSAGWSSLSGDAPPPAPRETSASEWLSVPEPVELSVWHAPLVRTAGAAEPRTQFVARPELGLWAVVYGEQSATDATAAVLIADVLQSVPHANTLTELTESVRQGLQSAYRELARRALGGHVPSARTIVFAARGAECALVWAGDVQAVRCRAADAQPVVGINPTEAAGTYFARDGAAAERGGLMELIAAPLAPESSILVHYQPLQSGDAWVLAGAPVLEPRQLPALAAALASQSRSESWGPQAVQSFGGLDAAVFGGTAPLLMLAARQVHTG